MVWPADEPRQRDNGCATTYNVVTDHDQTKAKHTAANRWVEAVNNWGELGKWVFHVCRNPQLLDKEMEYLARAGSGRAGLNRAVRGGL